MAAPLALMSQGDGGTGASAEETAVAPSVGQDAKVDKESEPTAADIFTLARQQNFGVAQQLLESYPQFWVSRDSDGHSLLHWASLVGHKEFAELALKKGVPVDCTANNRQSPLMWAALRGHVNVARVLLDAKADLRAHDSLGATPLMIAVQHRQFTTMLLFIKRGGDAQLADADKNGCTSQHWAAYKGDETALKLLEYFGANLNALDSSHMMPLHRAVWASQACVIKFLLDRGGDLYTRNQDGKNCFEIAQDREDMGMQMLLKKFMKSENKDVDPESLMEEGEKKDKKDAGGWRSKLGWKSVVKDKSMHVVFPVFWLICVSLAVFEYLTDLRVLGWEAAPTSSLLFELGVPMSLAFFAYVALTDPGKVPPAPRGHSGVEELMRLIDSNAPEGKVPDISRLCTTTWVLKDLRTKYCTETAACVREFDHYCIWLNCAIGRGNHRQFVGLSVAEFTTQIVHLSVLWQLSCKVVQYESFGQWFGGLVTSYPLMVLMMFTHCLFAPWVLMLVLHQGRLLSQNLTTNEMMNMARYEHFWHVRTGEAGRVQKIWRNPFDKGGARRNCIDFFWTRRRSETVEISATELAGACGTGCGHRHGHAGHGHSH